MRCFNDVLEAFWPVVSQYRTREDKLCLISQGFGSLIRLQGIYKDSLQGIGVSQSAQVALLAAKRESKTL